MRALRLVGDRNLELAEVEAPPPPGPGEVQIKTLAIALNHIDVWGWRGMAFAKRKQTLVVEGVPAAGNIKDRKLKFLRRIPVDPMTGTNEWGMRSYQDDPDATSWGGENVFDVYTKTDRIALDGTKYKDW